jgi:hypothetical protein
VKALYIYLLVVSCQHLWAGHLIYKQSTGELFYTGSPLSPYARGYSGAGDHKNNADRQCVKDLGPIPRGWYTIGPPLVKAEKNRKWLKSDLFLPLTPDKNNDMCGRSNFLIHGDDKRYPGWASEGCIVLGKAVREKIAAAVAEGDNRLEVIR